MSESNVQTQRDASDVGTPCSICSAIDFLPFKCVYCQRVFCKEHSVQARPEEHACPAYSASSNNVSDDERKRDGSATFKTLLPGKIRECHTVIFCKTAVYTRGIAKKTDFLYFIDRSQTEKEIVLTPEEIEKQKKKEAALALLRKNFPNTSTSITSGTTTNNNSAGTSNKAASKPVSKTIMILKLKQNAKPLDPLRIEKQIPVKERRYFFAGTSTEGEDTKRPFWVPKVRLSDNFRIHFSLFRQERTDLVTIMARIAELFLWESTRSPYKCTEDAQQE